MGRPIDIDHLRQYTRGNVALEREVIELFLGQLPETLAGLRETASAPDRRRAAHTLKGSGRAVGAVRIAALAEHAEQLLQRDEASDLSTVNDAITAAIEDVRGFVRLVYG